MIQVSAFIATSLDGFIAREDGAVDWLPNPDAADDCGFAEFFSSVDCLVMGRRTLETVLEFGQWPYGDKRVLVLSQSMSKVPSPLVGKVELYSGSLSALVELLESDGCSRIYVDGGATIRSFLNEKLLTDITITTIPILLGCGIRLFAETERDISLEHIKTSVCSEGFVQSHFKLHDY